MRRLLAIAALATLGLAPAGCGLGAGEAAKDVSVVVTRDYGERQLGRASAEAPGEETVMRALQRRFDVRTRFGGGFVQSIQGVKGGRRDGRAVDWFFYVNGVEAEKGAASTKVHAGDRIWWDNHDWQTVMRVPAVVGSWPEPFRSGRSGRKLPVRLDCVEAGGAACAAAARGLQSVGVKVAKGTPRAPGGPDLLRVLVGRWETIRDDQSARLVELGPQRSGVFARFRDGGSRLELFDTRARVKRTLGPGAGLVAATRYEDQQPVWFVTGTDDTGVRAAASALSVQRLVDHFALAVVPGGDLPLPVGG